MHGYHFQVATCILHVTIINKCKVSNTCCLPPPYIFTCIQEKNSKYEVLKQSTKPQGNHSEHEQKYELHWAACRGVMASIKRIMEVTQATVDPLERYSIGQNKENAPIHYAAYHGHLKVVRFFISELNCNPNLPGLWGRTPLHCAAQEGHLEVVQYLVEVLKCPALCYDEDKVTPLHLAAKRGNLDIVKYLTGLSLQNLPDGSCNKLKRCKNGSTPLNQAALHGQLEIVQFFISELGFDSDTRGEFKRSLLHDAAQGGHLHIVTYLIEDLKLDPPCVGEDKVSPIHLAAKYGHMDVVQYLVNKCQWNVDSSIKQVESHGKVECISLSGYNGHPSTEDHIGRGPICYAAQEGHLAIVKYLDVHVENLKCKNVKVKDFKEISLKLAAKHGHLDIVKYFTPEVSYWTAACRCSLKLAALHGHFEVVQYLVSKCELYNTFWMSDMLRFATENGLLSVIKYLSNEARCDLSEDLDEYKVTLLHLASNYGYTDVVEFLTKEVHCDPLKETSWGTNSLNIAAENGHLQTVKFFSELSYDYINAKDRWGRTPLYEAVRKGHFNIVKYLVEEKKVKPTEIFEQKVSLLHVASGKGHVQIVQYFIEERGCKMYSDKHGNTPLHWAAHCGQSEVVEYLVEVRNCLGINTKGYGKMTPLEQAYSQDHTAVVELLSQRKH